MFDLDAMSRWDEVLDDLTHHDATPENAELQEAASKQDEAPLRELEDA
jgi:hypothetical protein